MSPYRTAEYVEREPIACWDCDGTMDVRLFEGLGIEVGCCRDCFRRAWEGVELGRTPTFLGVVVDDETMRWAGVLFVRSDTPYT